MQNSRRVRKLPLPDKLLERCRVLRQTQTKPEQLLWSCLRNKQLYGVKFRRQHPVGPYIADFFCHELKLIVELDGWTHDYLAERDLLRQNWLESQGFKVLRFINQDILDNLAGVLESIASELPGTLLEEGPFNGSPHPNPLPEGEGIFSED